MLFVGRLVSNTKGCDKLLRIWKRISSEFGNWHLDIVGDGPDREELENYARQLGLQNYTFHGFMDPTPFYEKAKFFCMCSIYEGFGLVLTEAMQHGVVPVAFNSFSAVKDIIKDNENGLLISPFNEEQYATRLREIILDSNRQNNLSEMARTSVDKFSTERVLDKWVDLLKSGFYKS